MMRNIWKIITSIIKGFRSKFNLHTRIKSYRFIKNSLKLLEPTYGGDYGSISSLLDKNIRFAISWQFLINFFLVVLPVVLVCQFYIQFDSLRLLMLTLSNQNIFLFVGLVGLPNWGQKYISGRCIMIGFFHRYIWYLHEFGNTWESN